MHDPLRYNPGVYNPAPWQFRYAPKVRDVEHDLKDDPNDSYGQEYNAWIPETKIGGMSFGWLGTIAVGSVGMVIGWLLAGYMEKR